MRPGLLERESAWKKEIKESSYLGEISLSLPELDQLCKTLGTGALNHPVALTVLAINCCYYCLDNDGFWPHFCSRLGLSYTVSNTAKLGSRIEDYLGSVYKNLRQRSGTYRYVGAILEQCGITRKQLPRFADFLREMERKHGWDGILGLNYPRYREQVPETGSKYLLGFLDDEIGWKFVRSVASNLSQRDRGIIDNAELERLGGYHTSFWREINQYLEFPPPKSRPRSVPLPVLALDPTTRSLQIRLDLDYTNKSRYRLDGEIVRSSTISLRRNKEEDFKESYAFEVLTDAEWMPIFLTGWVPRSSEFAFFHEVRGYIRDVNKLKPGAYWLLAGKDVAVPEEIILSNQGTLSLFSGYYAVFEIKIAQNSDLSVFGASAVLNKVPYLSYPECCKRLESAADTRVVFTGGLPTIQVNNFGPEASSGYALVAELEGHQKRVSKQFIDGLTVDLVGLGFKYPGKGSLWIEATSRMVAHAGEQVVDRLDFAAIMPCRIEGPNYLVSSDESVEISFAGPGNYSLELAEGTKVADDGTRWMVGPEVRLVEGTLLAGDLPLRVTHRLYRANMVLGDDTDTILTGDLDSGLAVFAEGVPGTSPGLYLADSKKRGKICSMGSFNKAGRIELSTFSFRDAILARKPRPIAGRFEIGRPGGTVKTPVFYLDVDQACDSICLADNENYKAAWQDYLSPSLGQVFNTLYDLAVKANVESCADLKMLPLPPRVRSLWNTFTACSRVLDGTGIAATGAEGLDKATSDALAWYSEASAALEGTIAPYRLLPLAEAYPGCAGIPLARWKHALELKLSEIKEQANPGENLREAIAEWAGEVRGHPKNTYSGRIAELCSGKELVDCWRLYFKHGKAVQAYQGAAKLACKTDGIVRDLAKLLGMLTLVKLGCAEEAAISFTGGCNPLLLPLFETLATAASESDGCKVDIFPILEEDFEIFSKHAACLEGDQLGTARTRK
ncbi:hypothetical protein [Geomonas agri]|uniref:hypothetical protein n=1 Tax=Geomonas agri TaxID=2873702 RepID=UPI001CD3981A|nr:hypothetical protein [Geomonas agri]